MKLPTDRELLMALIAQQEKHGSFSRAPIVAQQSLLRARSTVGARAEPSNKVTSSSSVAPFYIGDDLFRVSGILHHGNKCGC